MRSGRAQGAWSGSGHNRHFDGAGHTQLVAQAADDALDLVVTQTNRRRLLGFKQLGGGAEAFIRINQQIDPDRVQQWRAVRAAGHNTGIGNQYYLVLGIIRACSQRICCF